MAKQRPKQGDLVVGIVKRIEERPGFNLWEWGNAHLELLPGGESAVLSINLNLSMHAIHVGRILEWLKEDAIILAQVASVPGGKRPIHLSMLVCSRCGYSGEDSKVAYTMSDYLEGWEQLGLLGFESTLVPLCKRCCTHKSLIHQVHPCSREWFGSLDEWHALVWE